MPAMTHFSIIEVPDASFLAGHLFKSTFGVDIPPYPRHFVALYAPEPGRVRVAGYVHFSAMEGVYLAGGLVADRSLYREIPREHLAGLGPRPSIGEFTMREGIARLGDCLGVFAYIGDARSIEVNRDVGYVPTHVQHLYACWRRELPEDVRHAIAGRVARLTPF